MQMLVHKIDNWKKERKGEAISWHEIKDAMIYMHVCLLPYLGVCH